MSGETNRAEDFDDFILDDEPAMLGLGGMFAQQPGDAAFPVQESGENAVLFEAAGANPDHGAFGDLREFSEGDMTSWEGHTLQPEEIGIPVESDGFDPLTAHVEDLIQDSGDLQLVDEESQLAAPTPEDDLFAEPLEQDAVAADDQATAHPCTVLVDGHFPGALQQGDGWESIELGGSPGEEQETPAWVGEEPHEVAADGSENEAYAAQESQAWEAEAAPEQAWDDGAVACEDAVEEPVEAVEEEPVEVPVEAEPEPEFAGALDGVDADHGPEAAPVLPMRRRWGGMQTAAAAALLLFGAGTAIAVDPSLFGMESIVGPGLFAPEQDDDLAVVTPRPATKPLPRPVAAPGPVAQPPREATPTPADPVAIAPVAPKVAPAVSEPTLQRPEPVAVVEPVTAIRQPAVQVEPVPAIEPVASVEPTPSVVPPVAMADAPEAATQAYDEVVQRTIRVSDSLQVGGFVPQDAGTATTVADLTPGASALAHLHNGNYFIGTVKAVDAAMVTLKLEKGEVTIASGQIRKVSKLGSTEFLELQRSVTGFVRLSNNNRLVGSILSSVADDNIVLEMKSDRIILPKSAIDEIVKQPEQGEVRFDLGESEEKWLQDLAERQLRTIEKERSDRASEARSTKQRQKQD